MRHVIVGAADAGKFDALPGDYGRIVVGQDRPGWTNLEQARAASAEFTPDAPTNADDPLLLYFTSGTTAKPKLVLHTHQSYPVGHLSTMYWIGLMPGDVHFNISSPGWAKHAWSNVFAPWNAGATVFIYNYARFNAKATLDVVARCGVTSLCAPPTVWRMLIQEDLASFPVKLRELVGAGEPLNPEVIEQVRKALGHRHPRRLRPDRDHLPDRQLAGSEGQAGLDGPPACRATGSRCSATTTSRPARKARSASPSTSARPG